jgi:Protein of unknown function (DUF3489)
MDGVAMSTFTIDSNNNITAHAGLPAGADESQSFTNQKELAKLTADWPISRLVDTWNSFAGVAPFTDLKPVKKFTNKKAAVARIWKAVERRLADVTQPAKPVAPVKGKVKKSPPKAKRTGTARPVAKKTAEQAREGSKKAEVLDLMRRSQGASLAEIMELTGWQAHTVRGFVSGTLIKKLGLKVESFRTEEKERTYRIK